MSQPLTPPIQPSAVYTFRDLDELDRVNEGQTPGYIYRRDSHPNAVELARDLTKLAHAEWGIVTNSGMSALAIIFLCELKAGDRVVLSNQLYGRTVQLIEKEFARLGVTSEFIDTNNLENVAKALETPTKLLFCETISNPLLRVAPLAELVKLAHARGAKLAVDNTFASPVVCTPHTLGADYVMESLTKMISGQSDVVMGFVSGKAKSTQQRAESVCSLWGFSPSPFDCWLVQRSLETLELRVNVACGYALTIARLTEDNPAIQQVIYPGLPSHPDHLLASSLKAYGHMLSVEIKGGREAANAFIRAVPEIPLAPSLGHTFTTVSYPDATSHRFVPVEVKRQQGISEGLLRFSIGCESFDLLCERFLRGLQAIESLFHPS